MKPSATQPMGDSDAASEDQGNQQEFEVTRHGHFSKKIANQMSSAMRFDRRRSNVFQRAINYSEERMRRQLMLCSASLRVC